jgi:ABC-2 type transport system ATP-binding protein
LILDEPANGLDPPGIIATRDLLRRMREEGKTVLLSSHMLGELEQVADWLVMLHQGKSLYSGPARAFLDQQSVLVVETGDAAQLDVLAGLARAAGHIATVDHDSLTIAAPLDFSVELKQRASAAGVVDLTIRARETTFEERFMALLQGEHR